MHDIIEYTQKLKDTFATQTSVTQQLAQKMDDVTGASGQVIRFNADNEATAENVVTTATENSTSIITSGGVYSAINNAIGLALAQSY